MINVLSVKKYKGAHILILNYWQNFVAIIFYRKKFYHCKLDATKQGEYTNAEYLTALDTILKDAHYLIEAIKRERSLTNQLKKLWNKSKQSIANLQRERRRMEKRRNLKSQSIVQAEPQK